MYRRVEHIRRRRMAGVRRFRVRLSGPRCAYAAGFPAASLAVRAQLLPPARRGLQRICHPGLMVPNAEVTAVPATQPAGEARFVTGSIMRHVVVMAGTGAIGLIAVFSVDLLNLFYISLLGQRPTAAAIGFAGVVGFFQTSVLIGLAIGVGAVVAHDI